MTTRTEPWPDGTPCWVDLSTPDVAAAGAFYASFLPWHVDPPDAEYGGYAMADVDGRSAAGMGPQQDGWPVSWTLYFASSDVDGTADRVVRLGGGVVVPPVDVGELGRMLIATDPAGAPFGVWQAKTHIGLGFAGEVGAVAWEDLRSTDPDASKAFFTELFGFRFEGMPGAGPDYGTFALADRPDHPLGGMGGMMGQTEVPSHWTVYFAVASVDDALAVATAGGATVQAPAFDTPWGRMAGLTDPAGASFWVHQPPPDPAP